MFLVFFLTYRVDENVIYEIEGKLADVGFAPTVNEIAVAFVNSYDMTKENP